MVYALDSLLFILSIYLKVYKRFVFINLTRYISNLHCRLPNNITCMFDLKQYIYLFNNLKLKTRFY